MVTIHLDNGTILSFPPDCTLDVVEVDVSGTVRQIPTKAINIRTGDYLVDANPLSRKLNRIMMLKIDYNNRGEL